MKYEPHNYQTYATQYIEEHPISAVLLDMGLGKTSITLTALNNLLFDSFEAHHILVIAPLRVARDTWPAETDKWDHLQSLICSVAVGTEAERRAALLKPADIYIINRENVQWLIEDSKLPFSFDTVVVDELSSFKNYQAKRFRAFDEGSSYGQANHRADGNTQQQRAHGFMGGVPAVGHGRTSRTLYQPLSA